MLLLTILIIIALMLYIFYKAKVFQSKKPMLKYWYDSKARIALGVFVFLFGLNQLFIQRSTVAIIIGVIFVVIGTFYTVGGAKAFKHFSPLAQEEAAKGK